MVTYLYHVFCENTVQDYVDKNIWFKTEKLKTVRSMPFFLLSEQTIFSVRTLKLFLPDVKVEIHTNKPKYHKFEWLANHYKNIKIVDRRNDYDKIKSVSFWCYRIRYTTLTTINDDVVMIDGDTYFKRKPSFEINDKILWVSEKKNMGILGLKKDYCHKYVPKIIERINKEADPEGKEKRAIDEIITLDIMKNQVGLKFYETGKWIRHYFDDKKLKWSSPTEGLFEQLREEAEKEEKREKKLEAKAKEKGKSLKEFIDEIKGKTKPDITYEEMLSFLEKGKIK